MIPHDLHSLHHALNFHIDPIAVIAAHTYPIKLDFWAKHVSKTFGAQIQSFGTILTNLLCWSNNHNIYPCLINFHSKASDQYIKSARIGFRGCGANRAVECVILFSQHKLLRAFERYLHLSLSLSPKKCFFVHIVYRYCTYSICMYLNLK